MFIDFTTFTKYFFYLFVCYHYAKHHYPEKTQDFIIFVGYNSLYLYSKLQIFLNKSLVKGHNYLLQYEKYNQLLSFLQNMKYEVEFVKEHAILQTELINCVTLHFVIDNKIEFTFEKNEFLRDYLTDFFPDNENETTQNDSDKSCIIDYDFIIVNGEENLKKIIKNIDINELKENTTNSSIFKTEAFIYKPLLCEFKNGDGDGNDDKVIKIDFTSNNKRYDFLVVDNCFDKSFLTFFMKKYYEVDVKDNYTLEILDNNVNKLLFKSSDIVKIENNCISKVSIQ
jgi:hypothetical protein